MGQAEVKKFLKNNQGKWFRQTDIREALDINRSTASKIMSRLKKDNEVQVKEEEKGGRVIKLYGYVPLVIDHYTESLHEFYKRYKPGTNTPNVVGPSMIVAEIKKIGESLKALNESIKKNFEVKKQK